MLRVCVLLVLLVAVVGGSVAYGAAVVDTLGVAQRERMMHVQTTHVDLLFMEFQHTHGKYYSTPQEKLKRQLIFEDTISTVRAHNERFLAGKETWYMGVNKFSDITEEEFASTHLGAAPEKCSATQEWSSPVSAPHRKMSSIPVPPNRSWRLLGAVSPVKDQGNCGSCWTFSTTGMLESAYFIKHGGAFWDLSEQQLIDCAGNFENNGCNGGLPSNAFEYIHYAKGLQANETYPYAAKDGTCKFNPSKVVLTVEESFNITRGDENELVQAIGWVQPVSLAYQVINGFKNYAGGVYSSDHCGSGPGDVNHAVLAVGYGELNGLPFYEIKNSWGTEWGDQGFFLMERGVNMCACSMCNSYAFTN